jgi:hypothetical protein
MEKVRPGENVGMERCLRNPEMAAWPQLNRSSDMFGGRPARVTDGPRFVAA